MTAANTSSDGEFPINTEGDIVMLRKTVRGAATELGFGTTDVTRIVTAASELGRNVYQYAGRGVMRWRALAENSRAGLELCFEDHGPGIPDIGKAMETGFTTGGGLGLGLPGTHRLMDEMTITSDVGHGVKVVIRKWRQI